MIPSFKAFLTTATLLEGMDYSFNPKKSEIAVNTGKKAYVVKIDPNGDFIDPENNLKSPNDIFKVCMGVVKTNHNTNPLFWKTVVNNLEDTEADKILQLCATHFTCKDFILDGQYKVTDPDKISMESRLENPKLEELLDTKHIYIIRDKKELICITDRQNWDTKYDIRMNKG